MTGRTHELPSYAASIALGEPFHRAAPVADPGRAVEELLRVLRDEAPGAAGSLEREGFSGRALVRALLTVRAPRPLPAGANDLLDGVLAHERCASGVVDPAPLPRLAALAAGAGTLSACVLYEGDITRLGVDAIVNAANSALRGCFVPFHACIDNAIHDRAGPRLRADCDALMAAQGEPERVGGAKVTRGYNLPARYVLHTVGPTVRGDLEPEHRRQLASSYESCLDLAATVGARSLALCGISTGVFGFPKLPAARIALATVEDFLRRRPGAFDLVVFDVFGVEDRAAYLSALRERATR